MKFFLLIILLLVASVTEVYPQVFFIENVETILLTSVSDTNKILMLDSMALKWTSIHLEKAKYYAKEGLKLAKEKAYIQGEQSLHYTLGTIYLSERKLEKALKQFKKSLSKAEQMQIKTAKVRMKIAWTYYKLNNYKKALEISLNCSEQAEHEGDFKLKYDSYLLLANINNIQKNTEKSNEYFQLALEAAKQSENKHSISEAYNALGIFYKNNQEYNKAIIYHKKALYLRKLIKNKKGISHSFNNLGVVYKRQKEYIKAIGFYQESLKLKKELDDIKGQAGSYINTGSAYSMLGDYQKAIDFIEKGKDLAQKANAQVFYRNALQDLSEVYEKSGDFQKAFRYQKAFTQLKDSLFNVSKNRTLVEMEVKYDAKMKEKENQFLKHKQLTEELKLKQQRYTIVFLTLFSLLAIITAYNLYRSRKKMLKMFKVVKRQKEELNIQQKRISDQNKELYLQNEEIAAQVKTLQIHKDQIILKNKDLQLHAAEIRNKNSELNQKNEKLIALDMEKDNLMNVVAHDLKSPLAQVQSLSSLIGMVDSVSDKQQELINTILKVVKNGQRLIKDLLDLNYFEKHQDIKAEIEEIFVHDFISQLVSGYKEMAKVKDIKIHVAKSIKNSYIFSDAISITRIMDNLVSNAIKFSFPGSNIYLSFSCNDHNLQMRIRDEGPGITDEDKKKMFQKFQKLSARPTAGESSTGLGLSIVKVLIERLNGNITFESIVNKGTTFTIQIPTEISKGRLLASAC